MTQEEIFLERHPFEDPSEKADNLCEIGYTFQKKWDHLQKNIWKEVVCRNINPWWRPVWDRPRVWDRKLYLQKNWWKGLDNWEVWLTNWIFHPHWYTMPKVDIPLALIKSVAVGGIAMLWVNFTLRAFKMAWHIISTSPEDLKPITKEIVMCENCQECFIDDGE